MNKVGTLTREALAQIRTISNCPINIESRGAKANQRKRALVARLLTSSDSINADGCRHDKRCEDLATAFGALASNQLARTVFNMVAASSRARWVAYEQRVGAEAGLTA
ncbi:hypothetical protein MNEG_16160 [Monoraphidium neglectum]|uniref:Uncharacterized protein n=1 Tax=Monoraphidium neglectum TaxID=145388 RepID=A0A0D2K6I7_9CHLO|nr:hypothetical protein MNEG_16160 [Monoraphidium neglectum]KIY91803.1 hypothetical protein MNEG_16160 [Monoraphidium neglectum]|eukprot:XP_013890823.1 hypothetical protein MNEG_16160 [Monoraphidium neglectum]